MPKVTVDLTRLPDLTNDKFYPLYKNRDRYLVLMGGGGSGKSVFAAQKIIVRMLMEQNHRFLVLRKVKVTLRESVFGELKSVISRWNLGTLFKINESDLRIRCVNGNEILFAGLDDVEKLKSIHGITGVWIEEASEIAPEDYRQLDIRLRTKTKHYKQMIITFNPIDVNHWLKKEFFDRKKPDCATLHSTYKDNRFLDETSIRVLEDFKDTDPYFYEVYALGQWGVLGKTVFPQKRLQDLMQHTTAGMRYRIDHINGRLVEDENGELEIRKHPEAGREYDIGADVAEGLPEGDYSAAYVIDHETGEDVAVLHGHIDGDLYGWQLDWLGRYYNMALLGVEINNMGHSVVNVLLNYSFYPNLYYHDQYNTDSGKNETKPGWPTNTMTRPILIDYLIEVIRDGVCPIGDPELINEMKTFVRNKQGKPQAQGKGTPDGAKDDRVMAYGIAHQMRLRRPESIGHVMLPDISGVTIRR
ncbi:PBSX family phage terminase large subunit [Alicyclobacillus dauci]|uniref:PBSX family phage terminase large subunit n=1 Tax=Alicyclobacillus dauci TaxID=1475485 RepID=A0ABY6YXR9_9BACL|nr:PBSX family phage terminase large subunit [Alicyclobacillus dauci]WAH35038.1 PBSX family phage terminase large subunit [Alicyclobacillus dauci]